MTSLIKDLDIDRVDAVDKPAHQGRFLILKSEDAAELQAGVQKLADASEALVDAISARKSATEVRKAARAVAEIIGKGEDTLTTLRDKDEYPQEPDGTQPPEMAGADRTAEDPVPVQADPAAGTAAHPSPEGDAGTGEAGMPGEVKGLDRTDEDPYKVKIDINKARYCAKCAAPIAKGRFVAKTRIAKDDTACPMCGAPTDDMGNYADPAAQQMQPTPPTPTPGYPAPAPAPVAYAEDAKPWDEEDPDEKKKRPFDPDMFAEKMAATVAKSVEASLTKFAESLTRTASAPIAKSRQAQDGYEAKAKVSYANLVFGQQ